MALPKYKENQFVEVIKGCDKGLVGRITFVRSFKKVNYDKCGRPTGECASRSVYTVVGKLNGQKASGLYYSWHIKPLEIQPALVELSTENGIVSKDEYHATLAISKVSEFDKLIALLKGEKAAFIARRKKTFEDKRQLKLF